MIKVKEERRGVNDIYVGGGKEWNLKLMGEAIREGAYFKVDSFYGEDITKQVLARIAFKDILIQDTPIRGKEDQRFAIGDVMAAIMTEDALLDLIEMGGAQEYMIRRSRGC